MSKRPCPIKDSPKKRTKTTSIRKFFTVISTTESKDHDIGTDDELIDRMELVERIPDTSHTAAGDTVTTSTTMMSDREVLQERAGDTGQLSLSSSSNSSLSPSSSNSSLSPSSPNLSSLNPSLSPVSLRSPVPSLSPERVSPQRETTCQSSDDCNAGVIQSHDRQPLHPCPPQDTSLSSDEAVISLITTYPYQPDPTDIIPPRMKGSRQIRFSPSWFEDYPWLSYDPDLQGVLCYTCCMAASLRLLAPVHTSNANFVKQGFSNWSKGRESFIGHMDSKRHQLGLSRLTGWIKRRNSTFRQIRIEHNIKIEPQEQDCS